MRSRSLSNRAANSCRIRRISCVIGLCTIVGPCQFIGRADKGRLESAIATLIDDLDQRGLLDSTLVLALGEFGRTPKINKDAGRDHWSNAMSVLVAGCGTPGGQVVGATDARGYAASERVLSPENLAATVYTKLGIDPGKILHTPSGRPTYLVSDPTPIRELMG